MSGSALQPEKWRNLAVFAGGIRLDSDLKMDGMFDVPGDYLDINYKIDQQNIERWNYSLGFNWEVNGRISVGAEYNGFKGSRKPGLCH